MPLDILPSWIDDPSLLPHEADLAAGRLLFLPTIRAEIEAASFLDGRTNFATGSPVWIDLDHIAGVALTLPHIERYIFHVGFCGSTFLSRLLSAPGHALVLREPNILANLANSRAAFDRGELSSDRLTAALIAARALLSRPWMKGEPVVVKPSNWFNNLLPDLCADPSAIRPLFLTMARRNFVAAVLRGGSQRLAFAARAAVHLSSRHDDDAALVAKALTEGEDIKKLLRLAAVLHHIQTSQFKRVADEQGWDAEHWLSFEELQDDPVRAAQRSAAALKLDLPLSAIERNQRHWSGINAKEPSMSFSLKTERKNMTDIDTSSSEVFRSVLDWAEAAIGI